MSLLMKKRQQEIQRNNGLNDPVKSQPTKSQNMSVNSWPAMGVPQADYPVISHPTTMHQQQSLTCSKFKEEQPPIKSLLQQAYLRPSVKKERKIKDIPSWSIPSTSPVMPFEAMNFKNRMNVDINLPAGAYYEEAPAYIDPTTGDPMTYEPSPTATITENASTDPANLTQSNRCINSNCSSCKNIMEAN